MLKKYKTIQVLVALSLGLIGFNATALNIDGMSPSELFELGENYESIGNINKSFLYYDKAAQENYVPAMLKMVTIFRQEGKQQQAKELLDKAAKTGDATALYEKALQLCDAKSSQLRKNCLGLLKESASKGNANAYRKLAQISSSKKQSYYHYLNAYALDGNDYELFRYGQDAGYGDVQVINDIERVLKKKGLSEAKIARNLAYLLYFRGHDSFTYRVRCDESLKLAKSYFQKAIELDPNNKSLNSFLAEFEAYGLTGSQNWEHAYKFLKVGAEAIPARLNDTLAFMYYYGLGTKQSLNDLLVLSSKADYLDLFAEIYAKGSGVAQNKEQYVNFKLETYAADLIDTYNNYKINSLHRPLQKKIEASAKLGSVNSPETLYNKGILLIQNKKYEEALSSLTKAAEMGNEKAVLLVSSMYARGLGCKKDYGKSYSWLSKISNPNKSVNKIMGINYLFGTNRFEVNRSKAKELLEGKSYQYIDLNDSIPIGMKAKILLLSSDEILRKAKTIKKRKTLEQAQEAYYYLLAAAEDNGEACALLGQVLLEQWEVTKAKDYFEKAVSLGYSKANQNLGFMFLNGYGTMPDLDKAMEYYSKENSKAEAFYQMSRHCSVNSDYTTAFRIWLLYKSVQEDPSFAGAWMDLLTMDPRRGDKKFQLKMLEQACAASKVEDSIFCIDYKNLRSGKFSRFF